MKTEEAIRRMQDAIALANDAKAAVSGDLRSDVRRAKLDALTEELETTLDELKAEGLESLEAARASAAAARHASTQAGGPVGHAEWAEVTARTPYLERQVQAADPADLPGMVRGAAQAGDRIGAYVLRAQGEAHLSDLLERRQFRTEAQRIECARAYQTLQAMDPGKEAEARYQARIRELAALEADLHRVYAGGVAMERVTIAF